ncbi:MAG: putative symporter YjmB [Alphaproteobacteria bacterium MarineAlpha3_Bin7]|nr:MAG: putative symporter YjmB [Alphaproteobacteria bacterium MarineAlpha3_Bin7]
MLRKLSYGAPGLALGIPAIPLLVYLPVLYADNLGLGLTAVGLTIFIARLVDVVTDPIIGIYCNQFDNPIGRRKPIMAVGCIISGVSIIFLLSPNQTSTTLYLLLWLSLLYLGWTIINIPYLTWGSDMGKDYEDRTKITSIREIFVLVGILVAGVIPAAASKFGYSELEAVKFIGWAAIGMGIIVFTNLLLFQKEPEKLILHQTEKPMSAIKDLTKNSPFKLLIVGWFANGLANGIPSVLFIIYMTHVLLADQTTRGYLVFAYFLSGIVGIPIWLRLSKVYGKHPVWIFAMAIACFAFLFVPLLSSGDIGLFLIITIITGLSLGADLALPPSMQSDVAEYEYFRTQQDRGSLLFAFWSTSTKLSLSLSVLIAFPLLELSGFSLTATNSKEKLFWLSIIYSVVPIVLKVIAIFIMCNFPLTSRKQSIIKNRLIKLEQTRGKKNAV